MPDIPVRTEATREGSIDLAHDYEVIYWTARLGCSSRQLREAVAVVGPRVSEVIAYLRRQEGRGGAALFAQLAPVQRSRAMPNAGRVAYSGRAPDGACLRMS